MVMRSAAWHWEFYLGECARIDNMPRDARRSAAWLEGWGSADQLGHPESHPSPNASVVCSEGEA
jgi:hypothetical protein